MKIEDITVMDEWLRVQEDIYSHDYAAILIFTSNNNMSRNLINSIKRMVPPYENVNLGQLVPIYNINLDKVTTILRMNVSDDYRVSIDSTDNCKYSPTPVICFYLDSKNNERINFGDLNVDINHVRRTIKKYEQAVYAESDDEDGE